MGFRATRALLGFLMSSRVAITVPRMVRTLLVVPTVLAIAISALGLGLRVEHALTFDGPFRGSDYAVTLDGVRWTQAHLAPFFNDPSANLYVRYQPPLWFFVSAAILKLTDSERALAVLAIFGWVLRQFLLAKLLAVAAPQRKWSALAALSIHALLPISVLQDGKVNPEGLHSGLFMLALFVLWRMERQATEQGAIRLPTAALFGFCAGIALLTKATSSVLMITAVLVLGFRSLGLFGAGAFRRLVRPLVLAIGVWCAVVGGWCVPNLIQHHHPFPHSWELVVPTEPELPLWYRRPLGWALPFEMRSYLSHPMVGGTNVPNFWAYTVIGSWTDLYNRGFCRMQGGGSTDKVWGAAGWSTDPRWTVSGHCIELLSWLARIGLLIAVAATFAVIWTGWRNLRTQFQEGSLVLPLAVTLVVAFVFLFALKFPSDINAVLNPKYLLSATTPFAACFGLWLAHFREGDLPWKIAHVLSLAAIGLVGVLVVLERFG
jgi:hypothetical protein